jgi:hypothetical protein
VELTKDAQPESAHSATSAIVIGSIALLALLATALGATSTDGRADLAGGPTDVLGAPHQQVSDQAATAAVVPTQAEPRRNGPAGGRRDALTQVAPPGDARPISPSLLRRLEAEPPAAPQSLSITSLGIYSPIVPVGLEPDGAMEIPGASEAGWYFPGRLPGSATGSSVIAAHVDYDGRPGVFIDLRSIDLGAEVSVLDAQGTVHSFVVVERTQVAKEDLPVAELFRNGGDPLLTLVTCGGAFDRGEARYADNIVVRAAPAPA